MGGRREGSCALVRGHLFMGEERLQDLVWVLCNYMTVIYII